MARRPIVSMFKLALVPIAAAPALLLLSDLRDIERMDTFLGRFHPVVLHLPIGILLLVVLLEMARATGRKSWQFPTTFPLFLGTFSAVTAMTCGILLMEGEAMEGALVVSHFRWGIATAAVSLICLALHLMPQFETSRKLKNAYRAGLVAMIGVMGYASHQGASITHGEAYLTEYFPWRSEVDHDAAVAQVSLLQQPHTSREIFDHLIAPVLASKCYDCHRTRSFKGGLIMDTYTGLIEGGESGPSIVPYAAADSLSIKRIHLPLADEEHMPPANEPQLSADEISLLEWWIDLGAPAEGALASFEIASDMNAKISTVTEALIAEIGLAADHEDKGNHHLSAEEIAALRAPLADAMRQLQGQFPGMVRYTNAQSDRIAVVSYHHTWSDDDLRALRPIADHVVELVLPDHSLGAESAAVVASMRNLEKLDLRSGHLDDAFVAALELPAVRMLNLFSTEITADALPTLARLTTLEELYVGGNGFTAADMAPLHNALPDCAITYETAMFEQSAD
ncbi:MAG: ribonuclease inhibitor [Synoicihabitans sp.]